MGQVQLLAVQHDDATEDDAKKNSCEGNEVVVPPVNQNLVIGEDSTAESSPVELSNDDNKKDSNSNQLVKDILLSTPFGDGILDDSNVTTAKSATNVAHPPRLFMANSASEAHDVIQNFAEETMTIYVSMRKMKQFGVTGELDYSNSLAKTRIWVDKHILAGGFQYICMDISAIAWI